MTAATVLDTWTTTGLRGSGSHDLQIDDVFVPSERSFHFLTSPICRSEPLYALRTMYVVNLAGVPLGVARAALEALVELAGRKTTRAGGGLRDAAYVQTTVARADGLLGAARSYVFDVIGDIWASLQAGDELTVSQRARYRLCAAVCCQMCVEVVDLMYQLGGGSSLYATSPLDRYLRDIHTVQQHLVFSPKVYETTGRMLLGLEPDLPGY
jgi:alkylation response protein AidB-like acyl-CoA dehydrogenase